MVKGYGPRNLAYGTSGHREIVRQPGIISPWLGVSSFIAFMNQQVRNVPTFIIHFKEEAEPYGGLASLCISLLTRKNHMIKLANDLLIL